MTSKTGFENVDVRVVEASSDASFKEQVEAAYAAGFRPANAVETTAVWDLATGAWRVVRTYALVRDAKGTRFAGAEVLPITVEGSEAFAARVKSAYAEGFQPGDEASRAARLVDGAWRILWTTVLVRFPPTGDTAVPASAPQAVEVQPARVAAAPATGASGATERERDAGVAYA